MSTTRRSFLKSIVAAIALSPVLCRIAESVETYQEPPAKVQINPEWVNAPYEVAYCYHPDVFQILADDPNIHAIERKGGWVVETEKRFKFENGQFVKVEKHL